MIISIKHKNVPKPKSGRYSKECHPNSWQRAKKLGRRRNAAHIKTVKQFFYTVYSICCTHEKVNPERNLVSGKFLPFSVVVLGNFRRFLFVIFSFLFLHLDFSFIYSKFSMPFWGFFYWKKFFWYIIIIVLYSTLFGGWLWHTI